MRNRQAGSDKVESDRRHAEIRTLPSDKRKGWGLANVKSRVSRCCLLGLTWDDDYTVLW